MSDGSSRAQRFAWVVVGLAIVLDLVLLVPELRTMPAYHGDLAIHYSAMRSAAVNAREATGSFWDPWIPELAAGHPVLHHYQPLSYLIPLTVSWFTGVDPVAIAAILLGLAIALLPLTLYVAGRWLELTPLAAAAAGALAPAMHVPAAAGLTIFGIGLQSYSWSFGLGLYSQAFGILVLPVAYAATVRLTRGTMSPLAAGFWLALLVLSHQVYAYLLALVSVITPVVLARARPVLDNYLRLAAAGVAAMLLSGFFLIPAVAHRDGMLVDSRMIARWLKDGLGNHAVLGELILGGRLWDGGRLPVITFAIAAGMAIGAIRRRPVRVAGVHLLFLLPFWCGRDTMGALLDWVPMGAAMDWHRIDAFAQVLGLLLAGVTIGSIADRCFGRGSPVGAIAAALVIVAAVAPGVRDTVGDARVNQAAIAHGRDAATTSVRDFEATVASVRSLAPGRVYAGFPWTDLDRLRFGGVPLWHALPLYGLDSTWIRWPPSPTQPFLAALDARRRDHLDLYAVSAVISDVTPEQRDLDLVSQHGRFRVYAVRNPQGYAGLVSADTGRSGSDGSTEANVLAWMMGDGPRQGQHLELVRDRAPAAPALPAGIGPIGVVRDQHLAAGRYAATVEVARPGLALFRLSHHPGWTATVDGRSETVVAVSPSFAAVPVTAGHHDVELSWSPGGTKPILLFVGWLAYGTLCWQSRRQRRARTWRRAKETHETMP